jgi:hypothetical protein
MKKLFTSPKASRPQANRFTHEVLQQAVKDYLSNENDFNKIKLINACLSHNLQEETLTQGFLDVLGLNYPNGDVSKQSVAKYNVIKMLEALFNIKRECKSLFDVIENFVKNNQNLQDVEHSILMAGSNTDWDIIIYFIQNTYPNIDSNVIKLLEKRKQHESLFKSIDSFIKGNNELANIEHVVASLPLQFVVDSEWFNARYHNYKDIIGLKKILDELFIIKNNKERLNQTIANEHYPSPLNMSDNVVKIADDLLHSKNNQKSAVALDIIKDVLKSRRDKYVASQTKLIFAYVEKFIRNSDPQGLVNLGDFLFKESNSNRLTTNEIIVCYEAVNKCLEKIDELFPHESGNVKKAKDYLLSMKDKKINELRQELLYNLNDMIKTDNSLHKDYQNLYTALNKLDAATDQHVKQQVLRFVEKMMSYSLVNHQWVATILASKEINIFQDNFSEQLEKIFISLNDNFKKQQKLLYECGLFGHINERAFGEINVGINAYHFQEINRVKLYLDEMNALRSKIEREINKFPDSVSQKYRNQQRVKISNAESELTTQISLMNDRLNSIKHFMDELFNIRMLMSYAQNNDSNINNSLVLQTLKDIERCYIQVKDFNNLTINEYNDLVKNCKIINDFLNKNGYKYAQNINAFRDIVGFVNDFKLAEHLQDSQDKEDINDMAYVISKKFSNILEIDKLFACALRELNISNIPGLEGFLKNGTFYFSDVNGIVACIEKASKRDNSYDCLYLESVAASLNKFKLDIKKYSNELYEPLPYESKGTIKSSQEDINKAIGSDKQRQAIIDKMCLQMQMHGYDQMANIGYSYDEQNDMYFIKASFKNANNLEKNVKIKVVPTVRRGYTAYNAKDLINRLTLVRNGALELAKNSEPLFLSEKVEKFFQDFKAKVLAKQPFDPKDSKYVAEFYKDLAHLFDGVSYIDAVNLENGKPKIVSLNKKNTLDIVKYLEDLSINKENWDVLGSVSEFDSRKFYTFAYPVTEVGSSIRNKTFEHKTVNAWDCTSFVCEEKNGNVVFSNERNFIRHGSPNILIKKGLMTKLTDKIYGKTQDDLHDKYIDEDITREYLNALVKRINAVDKNSPNKKEEIDDIIKGMVSSTYVIKRASNILLSAPEDYKRINNIYNYQKSSVEKIKIDLSKVINDIVTDRRSIVESALNKAAPMHSVVVNHKCVQFNFPLNGWAYLQFGKNAALNKEINCSGLQMALDVIIGDPNNDERFRGLCLRLRNNIDQKGERNYPFKNDVWSNESDIGLKEELKAFAKNNTDEKEQQLAGTLFHLIDHLYECEKISAITKLRYAKGFVKPSLGYVEEGEASVISHNMAAGIHAMELCSHLGFKVDFFCKSGEDRTGVFHAIYEKFTPGLIGEFEEYDALLQKYLNDFMIAMDGSIANEIADTNAIGAGFLQVVPYLFGNYSNASELFEQYDHDRAGKTAKKPLDRTKKVFENPYKSSRSENDFANKMAVFGSVDNILKEPIELSMPVFIEQIVDLLEQIHELDEKNFKSSVNDLLGKFNQILQLNGAGIDPVVFNVINLFKDFLSIKANKNANYIDVENLRMVIANPQIANIVSEPIALHNKQEFLKQLKYILTAVSVFKEDAKDSKLSKEFLLLKFTSMLQEHERLSGANGGLDSLFRIFLNKDANEKLYTSEDLQKLQILIDEHLDKPIAHPNSTKLFSHPASESLSPVPAPATLAPEQDANKVNTFSFVTSVHIDDLNAKCTTMLPGNAWKIERAADGKSLTITNKGKIATWHQQGKGMTITLNLPSHEVTSIQENKDFINKNLAIYWACKKENQEDYSSFVTKDNNNYLTQVLTLGAFCDYLLAGKHEIDLQKVEFGFCNGSILGELKNQNHNINDIVIKLLQKIGPNNPLLKFTIEANLTKYKRLMDATIKLKPDHL